MNTQVLKLVNIIQHRQLQHSKRGMPEGAATNKTPKYPGLNPHFLVDLLSTEYGWAVLILKYCNVILPLCMEID